MMANRLDQFPILEAIQGIEMELNKDPQVSHSLISNASSSYSSLSDVVNSQKSNQRYQQYQQTQQSRPQPQHYPLEVHEFDYSQIYFANNNNNNNNKNGMDNDKQNDHRCDDGDVGDEYEINPLFKIEPFYPSSTLNAKKPSLREHIFISKDCTKRLADYIVNEAWGGSDYGLLYKYLDYIFRCQLFKKQVIQIDNQYLMFHTGLQRRSDSEFLYALLIINNKKYVTQKWRVGFGNIKQSFLSKRELLYKLRYLLQRKPAATTNTIYRTGSKSSLSSTVSSSSPPISGVYETNHAEGLLSKILPQRTKFHDNLGDFLFDDSYQIEVNWEERILTNKDRICKILGVEEFTEKWKLRQLMHLFDRALEKTKKTLNLNPRLAVAQGFVDTKHANYRMELLLPITIEYPKFSNKFFTFALAISKSTDQTETYTAKSILTLDMAYANARLVSYVDSSWLQTPGLSMNHNHHHHFNNNNQQPPRITCSYPAYSANNNYVLY